MSKALDEVIGLLDLEQIELDIFRGREPGGRAPAARIRRPGGRPGTGRGRPYGPRRPSCALAARLLHPARRPDSPAGLHGGAGPRRPVVHDSPGLCCPARQDDLHAVRVIPSSRAWAASTPMPCPSCRARTMSSRPPTGCAACAGLRPRSTPGATRSTSGTSGRSRLRPRCDRSLISSRNVVWLRADGDLPDDPLLHVCLMTYASDMTLLDTVLLAHGVSWSDGLISGASLDHAMWFHRPFRADRWLLYVQDSPIASGGQGTGQGRGLHSRAGSSWCPSCRRGCCARATLTDARARFVGNGQAAAGLQRSRR